MNFHTTTSEILKFVKCAVGLALLASLAACNGGSSAPAAAVPVPAVAAADVVAPITATTVAALVPAAGATATTVTFNSGFSGVDATGAPVDILGAATVSFAAGATPATPTFNISNGGNTASGDTTFASCHFLVKSSTFPASSALAMGKTVIVNPCEIKVTAKNAAADGTSVLRDVQMTFGSTISAPVSIPVVIKSDGSVIINNTTVELVPITQVTGGGA